MVHESEVISCCGLHSGVLPTTVNFHRQTTTLNFHLVVIEVEFLKLRSDIFTMSGLLGAGYYSSDDDTTSMPKPSVTTATKVVAAPEVNTEVWSPTLIPLFYSKFFRSHSLGAQIILTTP